VLWYCYLFFLASLPSLLLIVLLPCLKRTRDTERGISFCRHQDAAELYSFISNETEEDSRWCSKKCHCIARIRLVRSSLILDRRFLFVFPWRFLIQCSASNPVIGHFCFFPLSCAGAVFSGTLPNLLLAKDEGLGQQFWIHILLDTSYRRPFPEYLDR
jgi:hypothetical protein